MADPRNATEIEERKPELRILEAASLRTLAWLAHGFSTRVGGVTTCYGGHSLNLGYTKEDSRRRVDDNRRRFLMALGMAMAAKTWPLITNRQIHSDLIHVVTQADPGELVGDGLISNLPGLALAVQTADCFPVLIVDAKLRIVGTFHAGWRGTVKRIVEKGAGIMRHHFGSRPEDLHAVIGPGIQGCCFEVGDEVLSEFESQFAYAHELFAEVQDSDAVRRKYPLLFLNGRPPGHGDPGIKLHLDLREANRRQLLTAGVPERQITAMKECPACDTRTFFSHRAERVRTGRMLLVAGIVP